VADQEPREMLGMTEEELAAYLEVLIEEHAGEVAAEEGTTLAEELESPGFAAARAATSYAIRLIAANNAYLTRHLLDLGVIPGVSQPADGVETGD
jgi:hypothetical protein